MTVPVAIELINLLYEFLWICNLSKRLATLFSDVPLPLLLDKSSGLNSAY